ncbi:hypothetical protein R2R35_24145 [Anaerocolumna sp. AGMB13020]|uniref:hypothetical protein n=1 Tax=Anaerocolumna sp. AGMB13020 TaxID=3081750 RepID=UPI0029551058|nr:hypothetical protein [Anaerocolumna sp. AGMB13020]WOO36844.1 hypothetical protein R2R35_24145 [Anaerocolumna sp. AGMB13020]
MTIIFISNIKRYIPPVQSAQNQKSELLSFYKEMYRRTGELIPQTGPNTGVAPAAGGLSGSELALKVLRQVIDSRTGELAGEPIYYLDVRSSEDFSAPAPDYYILSNFRFKHTKPLNIRGNAGISLIHAFMIMEYKLGNRKGEYAVGSVSQRFEPSDYRGTGPILADGAIGFLLKAEAGSNEEGFYIEDYHITREKEKFKQLIGKEDYIVCHNNVETRSMAWESDFRTEFLSYDFGCMDTFCTLENLCARRMLKNGQTVTLVSVKNSNYTGIKLKYKEK